MSTIPIGHIFSKAIVTKRDIYENPSWNLEDSYRKYTLILKDENVPHGMEIKLNNYLENLVVIEFHQKVHTYYVALCGYLDKLLMYYYCNISHNKSDWNLWGNKIPRAYVADISVEYVPRISKWDYWRTRWNEECGKEFISNFMLKKPDVKINNLLLNVFELQGKDYVLPIFGYKSIEVLKGNLCFFPRIITKNNNSYYSEWSAYKTDDINNFPNLYVAKIKNDAVFKDVIVFLHGFIYPTKWHYGIWKHVFALAPEAVPGEKPLWERVFNKELYLQDFFKSCKPNYKKTSCEETNCLVQSLFTNVHSNIKEYCKKYLESIVTFFQLSTTNTIHITKNRSGYSIDLVCDSQSEGIYKRIVFDGIVYGWDDQNKPALHICPKTMYLDSHMPPIQWEKNNTTIFLGSLFEINKCN